VTISVLGSVAYSVCSFFAYAYFSLLLRISYRNSVLVSVRLSVTVWYRIMLRLDRDFWFPPHERGISSFL